MTSVHTCNGKTHTIFLRHSEQFGDSSTDGAVEANAEGGGIGELLTECEGFVKAAATGVCGLEEVAWPPTA